MFADISGFTAWSSVREPSQVFTLLESVYRAFDTIARRRKVFKVETVGDAYVAVAGVPEARKDHAIVMARFAHDCAARLPEVVRKLERILGPGTGDIKMRFGLHSGPVTAGVLRGEKARFQLFGDTVNTAARVESSGVGNRVHVSEQTANLLINAGKSSWVKSRGLVHLKGKGDMKTFFLQPRLGAKQSSSDQSEFSSAFDKCEEDNWGDVELLAGETGMTDQIQRLVDWNAEMLLRLLNQIAASRSAAAKKCRSKQLLPKLASPPSAGSMVLDEVTEVIILPGFDYNKTSENQVNPDRIDLGPEVKRQLLAYISFVASGYNKNPFHNFEVSGVALYK